MASDPVPYEQVEAAAAAAGLSVRAWLARRAEDHSISVAGLEAMEELAELSFPLPAEVLAAVDAALDGGLAAARVAYGEQRARRALEGTVELLADPVALEEIAQARAEAAAELQVRHMQR